MIELKEMPDEKLADIGLTRQDDETECVFCGNPTNIVCEHFDKYAFGVNGVCSLKCYDKLTRINGNPHHAPQWIKWNEKADYLVRPDLEIFVELVESDRAFTDKFKVTYRIHVKRLFKGMAIEGLPASNKNEIVCSNYLYERSFYRVE